MKEISVNVKNAALLSNTLSTFLKKFTNLEKSILIKLYPDKIISTMSNVQKSVIKNHSMNISQVFQPNDEWDEPLYIPLVIGDRLTKILDFFSESEIDINFIYDVIDNKNVVLTMKFQNPTLNMELVASKISLFKVSVQITNNILDNLSNTNNKLYEINMPSNIISKIKNLSNNNIGDKLYIDSNKNGVFFKGDNFDFKLTDNVGIINKYGFNKQNSKNLDLESYTLYMMEDKTVFKNENNTTTVIISKLIE